MDMQMQMIPVFLYTLASTPPPPKFHTTEVFNNSSEQPKHPDAMPVC